MNSLVDQYLIFRLRIKRDPQAFAQLYDRYVSSIYRFVYLKVATREIAEDVTAETFLRCWQFIQQNKEIFHLRALLYRIARNLVADTYRKQQAVALEESSVTFSRSDASSISPELSDQHLAARQIEARAELGLLFDRISRLKEDFQDVLLLRLVEELPFGDIATVLEKKTGHVRVIYHRAMQALDQIDHERTFVDV